MITRAASEVWEQLDAEDLEDVMDFGQARATPRKLLTNSACQTSADLAKAIKTCDLLEGSFSAVKRIVARK